MDWETKRPRFVLIEQARCISLSNEDETRTFRLPSNHVSPPNQSNNENKQISITLNSLNYEENLLPRYGCDGPRSRILLK